MEVLISEVKKKNVLWNKRNPHYKDRSIVEKEWEAVAKSVGIAKEDAKKKWRGLRDQFMKEFKKIPKTKSGDSQEYPGKWQYFACLLFLKEILIPINIDGNIQKAESPSFCSLARDMDEIESNNEKDYLDLDEINANNVIPMSCIKAELDSDNQSTRAQPLSNGMDIHSKRKRHREENNSVEQQLLEIEAKKLALLQFQEDENSLFLRSLLPFMRQMDPLQQLRVRTKFQEVLMEEMQQSQLKKSDH